MAHDVYNEFMDLYDAGVEITEIKQKIEKYREEGLDDEEFEIFITAYALALWETGNLTNEILDETRKVIANGAGVKMWLEESGEADAKSRNKELEKFLRKISIPKNKPRKRKKYKKVTNFIFQIDDIIAFQLPDKSYRASILFKIEQYRGHCVYWFTPTSYMDTDKPTESAIKNCSIFINKIGCGFDKETIKRLQPGIEKLWSLDGKSSNRFIIGLVIHAIEHKDLSKFKERFEVIGKVKIKDGFKELGSIGYKNSFGTFGERYKDIIDHEVRIFKMKMADLKDLIES